MPSRESPEEAIAILEERGYTACEIDFEGKFWMDYDFAERLGVLARWEELGARVVASFCDDVLQVGPAEAGAWAWYLIFELDDLDTAAAMMDAAREEVDGVRLDRYVRFEVRVGRPFWAREEESGSIGSP